MLQAFPYQRFGTVKGTVRAMSNTVLGPTEISIPGLNIQEPVFRVRARRCRATSSKPMARPFRCNPETPLAADIVFDRRLVEWLFDPLFAVGRRS